MLTDDCLKTKWCKAIKCKMNLKVEFKSYVQCIMLDMEQDLHVEFHFTKFMAIIITLLFKIGEMTHCICINFISYLRTYLKKYPML